MYYKLERRVTNDIKTILKYQNLNCDMLSYGVPYKGCIGIKQKEQTRQ